ncbi:hypothetical protein HC891_20940 [Candidatus Gracilibacteria bacterium]|nr:hypothetical protein [Candidatus Gracilibacteria bacterium]
MSKTSDKQQALDLPPNLARTVQMAARLGRTASFAERLAARRLPLAAQVFSALLLDRFETSFAPGWRADGMAAQFDTEELAVAAVEMTVSPFAPPQRQLSAVRQGAAMWSQPATPRAQLLYEEAPQTPQPRTSAAPRPQPKRREEDEKKMPEDLIALLNMHRALGHVKGGKRYVGTKLDGWPGSALHNLSLLGRNVRHHRGGLCRV